ncbi:MAG: Rrf2 family transcriptional regulator [bacterium]
MKLSTRARYAIRVLLDVAVRGTDGRPVQLNDVAERTGISRRYLDQIVMPLKSASLLIGTKGRHGGYQLAKPPEEITLVEIVEATIGPVNLVECVQSPHVCERSDSCPARLIYRLLSATLRTILAGYTLENLADKDVLSVIEEKVKALEAEL